MARTLQAVHLYIRMKGCQISHIPGKYLGSAGPASGAEADGGTMPRTSHPKAWARPRNCGNRAPRGHEALRAASEEVEQIPNTVSSRVHFFWSRLEPLIWYLALGTC